jgi:hypothetical protein
MCAVFASPILQPEATLEKRAGRQEPEAVPHDEMGANEEKQAVKLLDVRKERF